jgi:hypothetical protein
LQDPDRDGLLTRHELGGLDRDSDGRSDEPLHLYGASPFVPDVFVEVDYMVSPDRSFIMKPEAQVLAVREFAKKGMNLHIFISDAIPFQVLPFLFSQRYFLTDRKLFWFIGTDRA